MLFIQKLYEKMNESEKEVLLKPSWFFPFWKHPLLEIIELPRNPRQFNVSWDYLLLPHLITGVETISLALRKQRRAQRMSSSFLSRPQFWSGADPPPPQFCAKEVAASTCPTNRRNAVRKMLPVSSGEWVRSIALLSS